MTVEAFASRTVLVAGGGVVLAEQVADDEAIFEANRDRPFSVDTDERPLPLVAPQGCASVLDAATGELLGRVDWRGLGYGPSVHCMAWNVGLLLLPTARGRGVGTAATRLAVRHLFATTDVFRLEWATDVDNVAAQKTAERAGFQREGVLRGAQLRDGQRRDLVHYSLLRSDLCPDGGGGVRD